MWHVFYRVSRLQKRGPAYSYAVCGTEKEAKEKQAECRRKMARELKTTCWIEYIAYRADLDG